MGGAGEDTGLAEVRPSPASETVRVARGVSVTPTCPRGPHLLLDQERGKEKALRVWVAAELGMAEACLALNQSGRCSGPATAGGAASCRALPSLAEGRARLVGQEGAF